jgi:hypothetical protein
VRGGEGARSEVIFAHIQDDFDAEMRGVFVTIVHVCPPEANMKITERREEKERRGERKVQ